MHSRARSRRSALRRPHDRVLAVFLLAIVAGLSACAENPRTAGAAAKVQVPTGPGSFFVLDHSHDESQVFEIDATGGEVTRSYPANADAAMAVSPDGQRLYVASVKHFGANEDARDELVEYDTATGEELRRTTLPSTRWYNTMPPSFPAMAVSPNGLWVHLLGVSMDDGRTSYSIITFDVARGEFLSELAPVPRCGAGALLPSALPLDLQVACSDSHEVHFLTLDPSGAVQNREVFELPVKTDDRVDTNGNPLELWRLAWAVQSISTDPIYAVSRNGQVSAIDGVLADRAETVQIELDQKEFVAFNHVALSPDGNRLYVGIGDARHTTLREANEIVVLDTSTWQEVARGKVGHAVRSMAISSDGTRIGVVDIQTRKALILDALTLRTLSVVNKVGRTPTLIDTTAP